MLMKYCISCGSKINAVSPKFCPECGFSFSGVSAGKVSKTRDSEEIEEETVTEFPEPEVEVQGFGSYKPPTFGEFLKQGPVGESYSTRQGSDFAKMTGDQIKAAMRKECGKVTASREVGVVDGDE